MGVYLSMQGYKASHGLQTSEQFFGIVPQPQELCPKIDAIISSISNEVSEAKDICSEIKNNADLDSIHTRVDWLRYNLQNIDLEDLRSEIANLRQWGQSWKTLAKDIISAENINAYKYSAFKKP